MGIADELAGGKPIPTVRLPRSSMALIGVAS